jgi:hypothetical protein
MGLRRFALLGVVAAGLVAAAPAQAINDGRVPGENCSPGHSSSVGDPERFGGVNPGIVFNFARDTDVTDPQPDPAVSANNPGVSTGARGEANSQAPCL